MDGLKRIEALEVSIGTLRKDLERVERMLRLTPTKQRILTPALQGLEFRPSLTFWPYAASFGRIAASKRRRQYGALNGEGRMLLAAGASGTLCWSRSLLQH